MAPFCPPTLRRISPHVRPPFARLTAQLMALHCHSKWESHRPISFLSPSTAHTPPGLCALGLVLAWLGYSLESHPPYNTSLAAYLSQYCSIPAALASMLWAENPIKAVPGPRPPSNCVRLGAPCSTAPSFDPGLAIVVAPSAPRSALPGPPSRYPPFGLWEQTPNGAETLYMDRWDACDAHGAGEWGAGFGYLHWFLAARLLLVYRGVKDVIQQGASCHMVCARTAAFAVSSSPPPTALWQLARAAGTLRPAFPLSGAPCVATRSAYSGLGARPLSTSFPPAFRRCAHIRNRSPPWVLRGTWRILRHIPIWS
ncbi:hypothetical protein B0H14DRAFT_3900576 [Mycena olivaceomarginata]|nr:hypothetical protein B0H14DRAFT_3900576 [Mycena olivaceomarginata]